MPITIKKNDELEKIWENLVKMPELEQVEFPEPDPEQSSSDQD